MDRIADGVYCSRVVSRTLPPYQHTNCYWVGDQDEMLLVDAGDGTAAAQSQLEADWTALGRPRVSAAFFTHYHQDHTGGAAFLVERWHCPVYLDPVDQAQLPDGVVVPWRPFDRTSYQVGHLEVQVVHAPGHTPGQCNFWIPAPRVLLAGDNVLGNSTVVIAPPDGHMGEYLRTLTQLSQLKASVIGPGHGDLVRNPPVYLGQYVAHRHRRNQEILALLDGGPKSPRELADLVYHDVLASDHMEIGEWMIKGHLAYCLEEGLVVQDDRGFRRVRG